MTNKQQSDHQTSLLPMYRYNFLKNESIKILFLFAIHLDLPENANVANFDLSFFGAHFDQMACNDG
jgi:hypothetical protein